MTKCKCKRPNWISIKWKEDVTILGKEAIYNTIRQIYCKNCDATWKVQTKSKEKLNDTTRSN